MGGAVDLEKFICDAPGFFKPSAFGQGCRAVAHKLSNDDGGWSLEGVDHVPAWRFLDVTFCVKLGKALLPDQIFKLDFNLAIALHLLNFRWVST
jgi:hypothetical protein